MSWARRGLLIVVGLAASVSPAGVAHGRKGQGGSPQAEEVRSYLDKATAAFALNHFAVAAENYEKAFELKPDPAVLYNAAQAHRLAGNKERALELYQSYLRMYGSEKRAEVEKHIENLKQAIEKDHAVATSPPTGTAPVGGATAEKPAPAAPAPAASAPAASPPPPEPPPPAPVPPPASASPAPAASPPAAPPPAPKAAVLSPILVTQASPPAEDRSITKRAWFWIAIGAVVAAGAVGGFLLFRPGPKDPTASLGPVNGN